ncbi:hypothetical protein LTR85_010424 [Meristemomyces frigidus]|nr:hypothetical protein LTR85_010424 [Meristemomyces frigidus]
MAAKTSNFLDELERLMATADIDVTLQLKRDVDERLAKRLEGLNRKASPLLRLPQELRDQILDEVLEQGASVHIARRAQVVKVTPTDDRFWDRDYRAPSEGKAIDDGYDIEITDRYSPPVLLRVCRQLRDERAQLYYGGNEFHGALEALEDWLDALAPRYREVLARIRATIIEMGRLDGYDNDTGEWKCLKSLEDIGLPGGGHWREDYDHYDDKWSWEKRRGDRR